MPLNVEQGEVKKVQQSESEGKRRLIFRRRPSTGAFSTARGMVPIVAVAAFLFALPLVMLGIGAFRNAPPGQDAEWSLDAFSRTFTNPEVYRTFGNSIVIAVVTAVLSTALALILVFLVARTTTPLRRIVTPVMVFVVALPPLFYAMSWGMLWNPRIGMINGLWEGLTASGSPLFDAYSWEGMISVMVIKGTGFCFLLLVGPFRAIDRSLEEAAQMSGAGRIRTILGIDLAVLMPAITGVVILNLVIGLEAFEVPLFLGTPVGIDVFSTQIYAYITDRLPADYGGASALSIILVGIVCLMVYIQWRILGRRKFTTVTGKSYSTAPWNIGPWRWAGTAAIIIFVVVGVILPMVQLVVGSLQPFFGGSGPLSLINYIELFADQSSVDALQSTVLIAVVGGFAAMVVAFVTVYAITHNETWMRRVLDILTWLPFAVPGIVLALGLSWTYVSIPGLKQLYGTLFLVGLGLVVAVVPIATRSLQPALMQINRELEEASLVHGARPLRMIFDVVVPLIRPTFFAGWFVVAVVISGNLAIPILLSSSLNPTVPLLVYELQSQGDASQAAALLVVLLGTLFLGMLVIYGLQFLLRIGFRKQFRPAGATSDGLPGDPLDDISPEPVEALIPSEAAMQRQQSYPETRNTRKAP